MWRLVTLLTMRVGMYRAIHLSKSELQLRYPEVLLDQLYKLTLRDAAEVHPGGADHHYAMRWPPIPTAAKGRRGSAMGRRWRAAAEVSNYMTSAQRAVVNIYFLFALTFFALTFFALTFFALPF